ncbi:MAG: autotransporter assembly complex protein TamA [Alphaproteobacteria bacterium]|nr:autotransporter assembly complex protein TamA [Alphaproteobacteria bacterium]
MRRLPILPAALCAAIGLPVVAPAWADSPVVIDGADHDSRRAILELLPDRDPPESLFDAERIAEEAAARALAWLRSEGYYGATVTPEATDNPPSARLIIELGTRFTFADPQVAYDGQAPNAEATHAADEAIATVRRRDPARAATVLQAESDALTALQSNGYADATAQDRRVVVDHTSGEVATQFRFNAGDLTHLGNVRAEPGGVLRPGFVDDLQNWQTGEVYSPQALARLRRDLTSTGAVSLATTTLAPPGENGLRDVVVAIEPAKRNAYELGVSYSTTEGAGVQAEWTRRNLTGRADSLSVGATLAEMQQGLTVSLTRPHAAGLGHAATWGASADREQLEAYTRQGVALFASVDASTRLRTATSYGVRLSADEYDDVIGTVRDAIVLSAFGDWRHDTTQFTLDPLEGSITEFRLEPSVSTGDETLGFVRATAEGRAYETLGANNRLTLAARGRVGWLEAVTGDPNDVPPDRRFYAGGGGSVRGYEYNSIYPKDRDALGLTPGGQGQLEGSFEARWRFDDRWGAAAFVDAGTAFDDWSEATDLSWGVGIGARYNLGFAPLRVDLAIPLDEDESSSDFALYISLGQAF